MLDLNIEEEDIESHDYDSHLDYVHDKLTLKVNYRMRPASGDELAFGSLAFPHLRPEPLLDADLERFQSEWSSLILDRLHTAFDIVVYRGVFPRGGSTRVEAGYGWHRSQNQLEHRVTASIRTEISVGDSAWRQAREDRRGEVVHCELELREAEPGQRTHLQILVANGRSRTPPADAPYRGVEIAAGGSADDVDMLLLSNDLQPNARGQTRALHQFGRYLGCWSRGGGGTDLMGAGDDIAPWHGWPWWRRLADHVDESDSERGHRRYASVAVIRLTADPDRASHAAELEDAAAEGSDGDQQAQLRENPDDFQLDTADITGIVLKTIMGVGLALIVGVMAGVAIDYAIREGI